MNDVLNLFTEYDVVGAFWVNIKLTFWSAVIATILGVLLIMMRISPISSLRGFAAGYTEFFKNMPLTIIMVFMVLGVFGQLKVSFSDTFAINFFWLSVVGLGVYTAAFVCESLRSGINTVPVGQAEASRALGLTFMQSATQIILPQAIRVCLPSLVNQCIITLKDSTIMYALGLPEIMNQARVFVGRTMESFATYTWVALIFLAIISVLMVLSSILEKRMSKQ